MHPEQSTSPHDVNSPEQLKDSELHLGDLPELESPDMDELEAGLAGWRGFLQKRRAQLDGFKHKVDVVAQKLFSQDIDGIHFTAKEMLAARFHPAQLKRNFTGNVNAVMGKSTFIPSRATMPFQDHPHAILDNDVLREAAYRKAIDGDEGVNDYLETYDSRYGETDIIQRNEWKELIAGMSGYALVRKIGLYGVGAATVAQSYTVGDNPSRLDELDRRIRRLDDIDRVPAGMKKAYKHKEAMDALRERKRQKYARDPFDF